MATGTVLMRPRGGRELPPDDSDALYEFVDGLRVELPPTSTFSNQIASRIDRRMAAAAANSAAGTVRMEDLFVLDAERELRRRPDVAFVSRFRWPLDREVPEEGDWRIVPDLCVEVTSPHDLLDDVLGRVQEYFRYGVRQVWVVWPADRQVYVYRSPRDVTILTGDATLRADDILPGFEITLEELFSRKPV
jgi:Uma2 family endonuclease